MASLGQEAVVVERFRIVEAARRDGVSEVARMFECSRTTVYKLMERYQQGGLEALVNRPRGPREPVAEELVELIVELKVHGPHRRTSKIRQLLAERYVELPLEIADFLVLD